MSNIEKEVIEEFGNKVINNDGFISWIYIVQKYKLSDAQIIKYREFIGWKSLIEYQKLSENLIEEYESEIIETNDESSFLLQDIVYYQILSDRFILKYFDKIKIKTELVSNQKCNSEVIDLLKKSFYKDEYLSTSLDPSTNLYEDLLENQYLDEDWIINNKDKIIKDKINYLVTNQRLTDNIISKLKIDLNNSDIIKCYNNNEYIKTELGKDWFITYAYQNKRSFVDYWIEFSINDVDFYYDYVISKVRVYYSDIIVHGVFKKVDIIRTYGECKDINIYKI